MRLPAALGALVLLLVACGDAGPPPPPRTPLELLPVVSMATAECPTASAGLRQVPGDDSTCYVLGPGLSALVESALIELDQSGTPVLQVQLNGADRSSFALLTGRNVGKQIAIVVGGHVYAAPTVNQPIADGTLQISGPDEAELSELLAKLSGQPATLPD